MNIKILNEHELQFNNKLFKIGDNISIETSIPDTHGKGRLFCLHPQLNIISIEYKNDGSIEAKPFFIKDITSIKKEVICKYDLIESHLTIDNGYSVVEETKKNYKVVNDNKDEWWYDKDIFK